MKKIAAHILVLFSSVLMLVLSVLPHHHHGDIIHFGVVERCETCQDCQENTLQGEWERIAHRHHHSSESDADCDLRQLFVISAREEHLLPLHPGDEAGPLQEWPLCLPIELFDRSIPVSYQTELLTLYGIPSAERLPIWQEEESLALRAPPFIIA